MNPPPGYQPQPAGGMPPGPPMGGPPMGPHGPGAGGPPPPPSNPNKKVLIIVGAIAVVILLAFGIVALVSAFGDDEPTPRQAARAQVENYVKDLNRGDFSSAARRLCPTSSRHRENLEEAERDNEEPEDIKIVVTDVTVDGNHAVVTVRDGSASSDVSAGSRDYERVHLNRLGGNKWCIDFS